MALRDAIIPRENKSAGIKLVSPYMRVLTLMSYRLDVV